MLNEAPGLPALLHTLAAGFPNAERIVVDGGSLDASVVTAMPLADVVLVGERGRARQMNLGAAAARGEILCFLHADSCPDFTEVAFWAAIGTQTSWGFCRVHLAGERRALAVISQFMNWRSRLSAIATGDQMLFVERGLYEAMNGFADIPLMEDVEICARLRRRARPAALALTVHSSGRRWEEQGVVPTVLRMWALRFAFWLGVPAQRLWNHYYGKSALQCAAKYRAGDG
ncbi:MAG: rSAM/selenodomain-associated transferase 2 [Halieaceae bacterium]